MPKKNGTKKTSCSSGEEGNGNKIQQNKRHCSISVQLQRPTKQTGRSVEANVVALARVWVEVSQRLGAPGTVSYGFVGAFIAVRVAGAAVAADSHRVGEEGVGVGRAPWQDSCPVLHLVVHTASLEQESRTRQFLDVAVLKIQV